MKSYRLLAIAASLLFAFGCSKSNDNDGDRLMTLRWDNLPTEFGVSDIGRIEVTTAAGTQQCNVGDDGRFRRDDASSQIESVTVHFTNDRGSIRVEGSDVTVSGTTLTITRDLSQMTFVYDRATLNKVRDNLAGNCLQIMDIDLSTGGNWTPIGGYPDSFTGTYDGGGLAIRNMTVVVTGGSVYAGLFGVNGGTLRNIHLEGGSVSGTGNQLASCGGVCGHNDGTITACSNSGSVSGEAQMDAFCGGVCGVNAEGTITACTNSGSVNGEVTGGMSAQCGGVCGRNFRGTITACTNSGSVSGEAQMHAFFGGVCGVNTESSTITACSNSGSVSGEAQMHANFGGVCGENGGTITACSNSGSVSGEAQMDANSGGVCGMNPQGTITACTNSGSVSGTGDYVYSGGVCGVNFSGTITYCYWGGASTDLVGIAGGTTTGATKFGPDAWPLPTMPGWGSDVWESLGGWNGGGNNTVFPTLKSPN